MQSGYVKQNVLSTRGRRQRLGDCCASHSALVIANPSFYHSPRRPSGRIVSRTCSRRRHGPRLNSNTLVSQSHWSTSPLQVNLRPPCPARAAHCWTLATICSRRSTRPRAARRLPSTVSGRSSSSSSSLRYTPRLSMAITDRYPVCSRYGRATWCRMRTTRRWPRRVRHRR